MSYIFSTLEELETLIEESRETLMSFPGAGNIDFPLTDDVNYLDAFTAQIAISHIVRNAEFKNVEIECVKSEDNPSAYAVHLVVTLSEDESIQAEEDQARFLAELKEDNPEMIDIFNEMDQLLKEFRKDEDSDA